ncbi:hypothetical protein H5410_040346 [Solanum commersonii]|uniref:Uncharacterized protein n=1 Tax=Solanum commersonii TaxID=4109 RepID=A0A9J5XRS3_SOLCO|nr:hypothetical protein H5410_040346 [Solanum commersonii]
MKASGYLMSFKRLNKNKNGASKSLSNGGDSQGEITTSNDDNNNSTYYKATSLRRRFKNLCSRKKKSLYKLRHHRSLAMIAIINYISIYTTNNVNQRSCTNN